MEIKTKNRAVVFIDGSNFYHALLELGYSGPVQCSLDYRKLLQKLVQARDLIEIRYYVGQARQEGNAKIYAGQRKFLSDLRQKDRVTVLLGRIEQRNDKTWIEKAVDVMISVDMVSMAYENKYDAAYLLSADGDFTPVVEKVIDADKKIYIASPNCGAQLASAAGEKKFIRMKKEFFSDCWREGQVPTMEGTKS